jgi:hypothetical protein
MGSAGGKLARSGEGWGAAEERLGSVSCSDPKPDPKPDPEPDPEPVPEPVPEPAVRYCTITVICPRLAKAPNRSFTSTSAVYVPGLG